MVLLGSDDAPFLQTIHAWASNSPSVSQTTEDSATQGLTTSSYADVVGDELAQAFSSKEDILDSDERKRHEDHLDVALCAYLLCLETDLLECQRPALRSARFLACYTMLLELHTLDTPTSTLLSVVVLACILMKRFDTAVSLDHDAKGQKHTTTHSSPSLSSSKMSSWFDVDEETQRRQASEMTHPTMTCRDTTLMDVVARAGTRLATDSSSQETLAAGARFGQAVRSNDFLHETPEERRWNEAWRCPQTQLSWISSSSSSLGTPELLVSPTAGVYAPSTTRRPQTTMTYPESREELLYPRKMSSSSLLLSSRDFDALWSGSFQDPWEAQRQKSRSLKFQLSVRHGKTLLEIIFRVVPFLYLAYVYLEDEPRQRIIGQKLETFSAPAPITTYGGSTMPLLWNKQQEHASYVPVARDYAHRRLIRAFYSWGTSACLTALPRHLSCNPQISPEYDQLIFHETCIPSPSQLDFDFYSRDRVNVLHRNFSVIALFSDAAYAEVMDAAREARRKYYRLKDALRRSSQNITTILRVLRFQLYAHTEEWMSLLMSLVHRCPEPLGQRCLELLDAMDY